MNASNNDCWVSVWNIEWLARTLKLHNSPEAPSPRGATILSDQLASLSTGLEAKSRLLDAKSRGFGSLEAWKNLVFFSSKIMEILGNPTQ